LCTGQYSLRRSLMAGLLAGIAEFCCRWEPGAHDLPVETQLGKTVIVRVAGRGRSSRRGTRDCGSPTNLPLPRPLRRLWPYPLWSDCTYCIIQSCNTGTFIPDLQDSALNIVSVSPTVRFCPDHLFIDSPGFGIIHRHNQPLCGVSQRTPESGAELRLVVANR
jgi:hypothetical protein